MHKLLRRIRQVRRVQWTRLLFFLFLSLLISACASRSLPVEKETETKTVTAEAPSPSIEVINPLIRRIKQNGDDIKKYFVTDDQGYPVVRADLEYENVLFEVQYDLGSAVILEDSSYNVRFLLRMKDSEAASEAIEDTLIWEPSSGNSGILLSLDDDYFKSWENHFDLFDKYNARVTFFIKGEHAAFCSKALSRGHDAGFHSLNHRDLRGSSFKVLEAEVFKPLGTLRDLGIPLSSFAFPYGFSDRRIREILLGSFAIIRGYGTTFRLYNEEEIRSGYIISKAIDNTVINGEDNFDHLIILMLRTVKFLDDGSILPLTTHDISYTASWGITPRRLEFLLSTVSDLKLKFYCYGDFAGPSL